MMDALNEFNGWNPFTNVYQNITLYTLIML